MNCRQRHRGGAILAVVWGFLQVFCGLCPAENRSQTLSEIGISPRIGDHIPTDLVFRDSTGRNVTLEECLGGKPVVLTPVYYRCPMLCGLELNGLVRCLRAMKFSAGRDFDVVTFSIDPGETPQLAAQKQAGYLRQYGRDTTESDWRFLTGDRDAIARLCDAIGFRAKHNPETGQYAHTAGIIVLTPEGRISRYFYGVEFAPRDLRTALVEASTGKLGTAADQVLLFCYAYDPTTGKYGLAILNLVRAAGVLTVLVIGAGISSMLWRERRSRTSASNEKAVFGPADGAGT